MIESKMRSGFIDAVFEKLAKILEVTNTERVVIAYSGGLDSSVLLHVFHQFVCQRKVKLQLCAVHINHQISDNAAQWEAHCRSVTQELGIPFIALPVTVDCKENIEAVARKRRYDALQTLLEPNTVLCTAHHRNDQAETLLLNMLRGTGTSGLAGIRKLSRLSPGWMARPLLDFSRMTIRAYAEDVGMVWCEDESNADLHYARNYIRHALAPVIEHRWQNWDKTFARTAGHQARIHRLVGTEVERWLGRCLINGKQLSRKACRALPVEYRSLVLRSWIESYHIPPLSESKLLRVWDELIEADARNGAAVRWSDMEFRFYRGLLYLMKLPRINMPQKSITWQHGSDINLPNGVRLLWHDLIRQAPDLQNSDIHLCFRGSCQYHDCKPSHRKLKKLFQTHSIPPWEREQIPLIYADNHLRLIWNVAAFN